MKKYLLFLTVGVLVSFVLMGCLGGLKQQAERGNEGMAESMFETYSKLEGVENGIGIIEIENPLSTSVWIKITMVEYEDAWKLFEIPGQDTVQIEVGATKYLLQIQSEEGDDLGNVLPISDGNASVYITSDASNEFNISIPSEG